MLLKKVNPKQACSFRGGRVPSDPIARSQRWGDRAKQASPGGKADPSNKKRPSAFKASDSFGHGTLRVVAKAQGTHHRPQPLDVSRLTNQFLLVNRGSPKITSRQYCQSSLVCLEHQQLWICFALPPTNMAPISKNPICGWELTLYLPVGK